MKIKRCLGLLQIVCFLIFIIGIAGSIPVKTASSTGMGDIGYTESRIIDRDVELEYVMGTNNSGEQKAYTVEMAKAALEPLATFGTYVNGGEQLTSMLALEEAKNGKKVVAAINGDFYDTSNGVPSSIMIVNGRFVTSGTGFNSQPALGIKADGSVIYGKPSISVKLNDGGVSTTINYLNNDRKYNETSLFLYSSDYAATTKTVNPGKEVRLGIDSGDFYLGSTITATVEATGTHNMAIGENKIVLSCVGSALDGLTVGKTVSITVTDNSPGQGWSDVVQAIGYNAVLAEDGVLTTITSTDTAIHPRSAIGVKGDGSLVLFQVDGRQPGWSNGLSYKQIAEHLVNKKGCKTVFNLDGGGSSTLMIRLPGDESAGILNIPSDGIERSNSNALLFFSKTEADPDKTVAHLHTYPNNLVILEDAATSVITKATDKNFYPLPVPSKLTYKVNGNIGNVDDQGKFTARHGSGVGTITVSSGAVTATLDVTVVDAVTNIIADKTYLSTSPGDEVEFRISAYKDGMPITASNSSFTWELSTPVLGSIKDGIFVATSGSTSGFIYISYKDFRLEIPVDIGKQPIMISTFEDAVVGANWQMSIENPANGAVGAVSVNTDERYVKFGNKSLRVDYDFTRAVGTTSVTAHFNTTYYDLDGYPSHIGMWVYGDMGGANVRIMIYDGTNKTQYISFIPDVVTWGGWQYIEAEIPSGLPTPLKIRYPIRVMSVDGKVKSSGTLYFDNLRAVYGFRNDDKASPQTEIISPAEDETVTSLQPALKVRVWDEPDIDRIVTGINKASVKLWINEEEMSNVLLTDNPDGTIDVNYTPSALTKLRPGPQAVKLRVEDNYGNITIKEWQFFVEGDYVGVDAILPDNKMIFAGDTFAYTITANTYQDFEKFTGTLLFNNRALEILSVQKVDPAVTLGAVNINGANASGALDLICQGMKNLIQPENKQLIKIVFKTKDGFRGNSDTAIVFKNVKVTTTGFDTPISRVLPPYEVKINYRYILSYITSTIGRDITFTVTDNDMNPVSEAGFVVEGQNITLVKRTGPDGTATFSNFINLKVGDTFTIYAQKGNYYSEKVSVSMVASLGSDKPYNIVVGPGADISRSVNISWQTNLDIETTAVQYRKKGSTQWVVLKAGGQTKDIHVLSANVMREYLAHWIHIDNLEPGTEYEYQVGSNKLDEKTTSPIGVFKTAPADDISFLFLGDPQNSSVSGYQITKSVIDAAFAVNPHFAAMLLAGDIVDDVNMYGQWQAFETVLSPYVGSTITVAASGNHDVIRKYSDPFAYTFVGPDNGVDVLGVCYYVEAGSAIIAVIDTETPTKFEEQAEWLKDVMCATEKTFKIVLMHRSSYAANYDEPHIRDFWPDVFDEARVDIVLSGHDHVYNSTIMSGHEKINLPYGVVYVVGGSSGGKFYNASNLHQRPWIDLDTLYDDDNPVFNTLDLSGDVLSFKSYALKGGNTVMIDEITIDKGINRAREITVINPVQIISAGDEYEFNAVLKDNSGKVFPGTITYALKEGVPGVSITEEGKLSVSSDISDNATVTVVLSFKDIKAYITLTVKKALSPGNVLDELMAIHNDFIHGIFKE